MGSNIDGKLCLGNVMNNDTSTMYTTPTLMNYFNGKTITHFGIGGESAVIATRTESTLFSKVQHHKKKQTYQDVIIICSNTNFKY